MLSCFIRLKGWLRHGRAKHAIVGCGAGLGILLAFAATAVIMMARQGDIEDAARELRNTAFVLAQDTARRYQAAETVALGLGTEVALSRQYVQAAPALGIPHEALRRGMDAVPEIASITVLDAGGGLLATSIRAPPPDRYWANQDFVHALRLAPALSRFVAAPARDPDTGAWTSIVAHPVTADDGQLMAIVAIALDLRSFETLFSGLRMRPQSSMGLFRNDGLLLVRYPHLEAEVGRRYDVADEYQGASRAPSGSVLQRRSHLDGIERLIAPQQVAGYPLIVTATSTMDSILRDWRMLARSITAGLVITQLVLGLIVAMGFRHLQNQERLAAAYAAGLEAEAGLILAEAELQLARERAQRAQEARQEAVRFDTALANMRQGVLMFDHERRLKLINRRFQNLMGLPLDRLRLDMSHEEFVSVIQAEGNVVLDDIHTLVNWRNEMVTAGVPAAFTWELADGRILSVTHQPMEDGWLATYEDITELRRVDAQLAYMARHDPLTGLPNRLLFGERLEVALAFARRGHALATLCIDLDQFKSVNDTLGHGIGDALLKGAAGRLAAELRETDTLARMDGDEFAVIQAPVERPADVVSLASRISERLREPFEVSGDEIVIGASIGIAFAPQDGTDVETVLKNANLALHRAKAESRGSYRLFQSVMDAEQRERRSLEIAMRGALPAGQFDLFYQPLISAKSGTIAGCEALLRWRHPARGLVPPAHFIPLAEEIGLIIPIGAWVLRTACAEAVGWPDQMRLAVNLSPTQFKSPYLTDAVTEALCASRLPPDRLELEITETAMMQDTPATLAILRELQSIGVRIAMDDFGTGYSSLSYLRRFPFDRIKIDQSFVREVGRQHDSMAIIRAVMNLSQELGIATTAEGVETCEQLQALVGAGCDDIQGFLFSPPVPKSELPGLLRGSPHWAELVDPALAA